MYTDRWGFDDWAPTYDRDVYDTTRPDQFTFRDYDRVLELSPNQTAAYYWRGLLRARLGSDLAGARDDLERYLAVPLSDEPREREYRAEARRVLGSAVPLLVLEDLPALLDAREDLRRINALLADCDEAPRRALAGAVADPGRRAELTACIDTMESTMLATIHQGTELNKEFVDASSDPAADADRLIAIAARLAHGDAVPEAVRSAQDYTWCALERGYRPGGGQHVPDRLHAR